MTVNKVKCLVCNIVLESLHRHDYKTCDCPQETMVDGGHDYHKWGGKDLDKVAHWVGDKWEVYRSNKTLKPGVEVVKTAVEVVKTAIELYNDLLIYLRSCKLTKHQRENIHKLVRLHSEKLVMEIKAEVTTNVVAIMQDREK